MKRVAYMMALVLAAPMIGSAQAPALAQGPAERLLAHRSELGLTAEQVQKLEAIDKKYDAQNQDLVARLETARGKAVGQPLRMRDLPVEERDKLVAKRQEIQPLMQQLRASHQAAIGELRGVLTAEQSTRANSYLYQGPGQGQGRGPGAAMRGQGQGFGRGAGQAMRGAGNGRGAGRAMMGAGRGQGGGRGMMRHAPGTGGGRGWGNRAG